MAIAIGIAQRQSTDKVDLAAIRRAVKAVLSGEDRPNAEISIATVNDGEMHALNRQYLDHDYPTDVLSFVLDDDGDTLEGEIIVSVDTAARIAVEYDWSASDELLLYVIHGTLHLVGYDDHLPSDKSAMQSKEDFYLAQCGVKRRKRAAKE